MCEDTFATVLRVGGDLGSVGGDHFMHKSEGTH
jgi:hypothetical protein